MKNIKELICVALCTLLMIGLGACNEEEKYDFPGDAVNRIYVKSASVPEFNFIHTPVQSMSLLDFSMSVYCTQKAAGSIKVGIEIDNSLVAEYNAKNGTSYDALPDGALVIENSVLTINPGEQCSSDELRIVVNEDILPELRSEAGYLVPLRLSYAEGGDVAVSTNMNQAYFTVTTLIDAMINNYATNDDLQGTLVSDRSGWTAYLTEESQAVIDNGDGFISGYASDMFDDDTVSEWYVSIFDNPVSFIVDLGKEYQLTAIHAVYSWYSRVYQSLSTGTQIFSSLDGNDWSELGTITYAGFSNSDYIILYGAIPVRYLKIIVPKESWVEMEIGEFNIYENN